MTIYQVLYPDYPESERDYGFFDSREAAEYAVYMLESTGIEKKGTLQVCEIRTFSKPDADWKRENNVP